MALGKPVIGSAVGGIPELIDDGENGLLFTMGDERDLREKIKMLMNDSKLASRMGSRAREKVLSQYSREVHYRKVMEVYEEAVQR
jgi:glycosyltransferase involved in cell wall biosynthesis